MGKKKGLDRNIVEAWLVGNGYTVEDAVTTVNTAGKVFNKPEKAEMAFRVDKDSYVYFSAGNSSWAGGEKADELNIFLEKLKLKKEAGLPKVFIVCAYKKFNERTVQDILHSAVETLGFQPSVLAYEAIIHDTLIANLKKRMREADHFLLVMTTDEEAFRLDDQLKQENYRPRPNVLLELGMAIAYADVLSKNFTVVSDHRLSEISDINGIHHLDAVRLENDADFILNLRETLAAKDGANLYNLD